MTDPSVSPDPTPPARPAWVKVSLIVAAVGVALVVLIMAFSGGEHGPGRHLPGGEDHRPAEQHSP